MMLLTILVSWAAVLVACVAFGVRLYQYRQREHDRRQLRPPRPRTEGYQPVGIGEPPAGIGAPPVPPSGSSAAIAPQGGFRRRRADWHARARAHANRDTLTGSFNPTMKESTMSRVSDARAAVLDVFRMYTAVHQTLKQDAVGRVNEALDALQAATLAEAQAPATPPPLPAGHDAPPPIQRPSAFQRRAQPQADKQAPLPIDASDEHDELEASKPLPDELAQRLEAFGLKRQQAEQPQPAPVPVEKPPVEEKPTPASTPPVA